MISRNKIRRYRAFGIEPLEDRAMLSISAVSLRVDGTNTGNVGSTFSQQSADGRYVVFRSAATNLVSGVNDVNGFNSDIFRRDRLTGKTELVSVSRFAANRTPNGPSFNARVSANGRFVVFESDASDLVANDTNGGLFGQPRDVFVRDMVAKKTMLVSVNLSGGTSNNAQNMIRESDQTDGRLISDNGRYVVFQSRASNLVVGDNNGQRDVFVRDIIGKKTFLVNVNNAGQAGQGPSDHGVISADGRYVAFESHARNLIANDFNFNPKVFRHDLQTRNTTLVSNNDLQNGSLVSGGSFLPKISADGQVIVFESFRRNMVTGQTTLVTGRLGSATQSSNNGANFPVVSRDGRYVTCHSTSTDLISRDTNSGNGGMQTDVFAAGAAYTAPPSSSSELATLDDYFSATETQLSGYVGIDPSQLPRTKATLLLRSSPGGRRGQTPVADNGKIQQETVSVGASHESPAFTTGIAGTLARSRWLTYWDTDEVH